MSINNMQSWVYMNQTDYFETPALEVFINTGFDMEYRDTKVNSPWVFHNDELSELDFDSCQTIFLFRPRIRKEQVLLDYNFIEPLEGFVWQAWENGMFLKTSAWGEYFKDNVAIRIDWISFQGVQKGSKFESWARVMDIPILD